MDGNVPIKKGKNGAQALPLPLIQCNQVLSDHLSIMQPVGLVLLLRPYQFNSLLLRPTRVKI